MQSVHNVHSVSGSCVYDVCLSKNKTMSTTSFILNDEATKNSHGFYLCNSGGDFSRFTDNPVMLFSHDMEKLIGRWNNLRIDNGRLLADPEFDEDDEVGLKCKKKVDKGYLKGASPGIIIKNAEYRDNLASGTTDLYVTKWELFEGSVVSVPSNAGALSLKIYSDLGDLVPDRDIKLYIEDIVKLGVSNGSQSITNTITMEKITLSAEALVALGVADTADQGAVSAAIVKLGKTLIDATAKSEKLQQAIDANLKLQAEQLVSLAVTQGKISADKKQQFIDLALSNYDLAKSTLDAIPAKVSLGALASQIQGGTIPSGRENWTYLKWLKEDPTGLAKIKAEDPDAFESIKSVTNQ